jgi:hypothetical protein
MTAIISAVSTAHLPTSREILGFDRTTWYRVPLSRILIPSGFRQRTEIAIDQLVADLMAMK